MTGDNTCLQHYGHLKEVIYGCTIVIGIIFKEPYHLCYLKKIYSFPLITKIIIFHSTNKGNFYRSKVNFPHHALMNTNNLSLKT